MTKITYEIVEHDGGWAYRANGVFSETFSSHDAARKAAERAAKNKSSQEIRRVSRTKTGRVIGTTNCRQAMIDPRPTSRADAVLIRRVGPWRLAVVRQAGIPVNKSGAPPCPLDRNRVEPTAPLNGSAGHDRTFGPLKVSSNEMCDLGNAIHLELVDCPWFAHTCG